MAQLVERQTLDILPGSGPGSSRFGARYIRASCRDGPAGTSVWVIFYTVLVKYLYFHVFIHTSRGQADIIYNHW